MSIEHILILLFHLPSSKYVCVPGHQVSKSSYSSVWGKQVLGISWCMYWSIRNTWAGYDACDPENMNSPSSYKLFLWIGLNNLVLLQSSLHRVILSCPRSQKRSALSTQPLSLHSHFKVISRIKISSHWLKSKMHASKKLMINLFLFKRLYWGKENEMREGNIGAAR